MMKNFNLTTGFILFFVLSSVMAQGLPENPLAGREVLEKAGCMKCHAVNGAGGSIGPDFGKQVFSGDDYVLFSKMWNHSAKMMLEMARTRTERPNITGRDLHELSSFLSFVRYLGEPGNVSAGKKLFVGKGCVDCHSVGRAKPGKIALDSMKIYMSPVHLAQEMWNHSLLMHHRGMMKGIRLPQFKGSEFADLTAYIRSASVLKTEDRIYAYPGDPKKGEQLFKTKGCYYCHVENTVGPKLDRINTDKSVTEIAGIMWNHSGNMAKTMKHLKRHYPTFTGDEMADVISYLYFTNAPRTTGSVEAGKRLFDEKGCESCHRPGNHFHAPTIDKLGPFHNEDDFLAALWNQTPQMEVLLLARGKKLPRLMPNEIKSLYLFIDAESQAKK